MEKKIITIWANKADTRDWLSYANRIDCRNRPGYEMVSYIGYNVKTMGEYTSFECDTALGQVSSSMVLTINIDSISDYVK